MGFVGVRAEETRGSYTGRADLGRVPRFMNDVDNWREVPEYEELLFRSPVAEFAARLMRATKANLVLQDVVMKEPGAEMPSPWHHDVPNQPLEGDQSCSVWIPLDPIRRENGIEYVRGSHRWGKAFLPLDMADPEAHYGADLSPYEQMPDIDAHREDYEILSWEMEPGDCIVHHGYALHGAPGNTSPWRRRTFIARFAGDDVRYYGSRHLKTVPDYPHCTLADGAPLDSDTFPVVWRA